MFNVVEINTGTVMHVRRDKRSADMLARQLNYDATDGYRFAVRKPKIQRVANGGYFDADGFFRRGK